MIAFVYEVLIGLVGNHDEVVFYGERGNFLSFFARKYRA